MADGAAVVQNLHEPCFVRGVGTIGIHHPPKASSGSTWYWVTCQNGMLTAVGRPPTIPTGPHAAFVAWGCTTEQECSDGFRDVSAGGQFRADVYGSRRGTDAGCGGGLGSSSRCGYSAIMGASYDAFVLVSFGGPEGPADVLPFLENVLRGRNVPRERMLAVAEHYQHFGGKSPINDQNRALIAALQEQMSIYTESAGNPDRGPIH